jgi:hypothetical protein
MSRLYVCMRMNVADDLPVDRIVVSSGWII